MNPRRHLDVTIQAQILDLLGDLQKETGMAIILITHDLGVVARMADEVLVMYAGEVVEKGSVDDIFYRSVIPIPTACGKPCRRIIAKVHGGRTNPCMPLTDHRQIYLNRPKAALITPAAPTPCRFAHSKPRQRATWCWPPCPVLAPP